MRIDVIIEKRLLLRQTRRYQGDWEIKLIEHLSKYLNQFGILPFYLKKAGSKNRGRGR